MRGEIEEKEKKREGGTAVSVKKRAEEERYDRCACWLAEHDCAMYRSGSAFKPRS